MKYLLLIVLASACCHVPPPSVITVTRPCMSPPPEVPSIELPQPDKDGKIYITIDQAVDLMILLTRISGYIETEYSKCKVEGDHNATKAKTP